ncbi:MAG: hypothetical protein ACFE95_13495 [Candidatus Hodarchaeota archaeon]
MKDRGNIAIILSIIAILLSLFVLANSNIVKLRLAKNTIANITTRNVGLEKENKILKRNLDIFLSDLRSIKDKNDELKAVLRKYRVE